MKGKNVVQMNGLAMQEAVEEYLKKRAHPDHRNFEVTGVRAVNYEFQVTVCEVEDDQED